MTKKYGFTIVELLVVIVVIGVLASIVAISFSGMSERAIKASLQADIGSAQKQLELFKTVNDENYPTTISCPDDTSTNKCIKLSGDNSIVYYSADNSTLDKKYNMVIKNKSLYYSVTDNSSPNQVSVNTYYTNTAGDGSVMRSGLNWYTVRDQSYVISYVNADGWESTANPVWFPSGYGCEFGCEYKISRIFLPFDTRSIAAGDEIVGGYLRISFSASSASMTVHLTSSSQASPTNLVGDDYLLVGPNDYSRPMDISVSSGTLSYNFDLNSAGIANINKAGYSKYALRSHADMLNIAPTAETTPLNVRMFEDSNINYRPQLVLYVKQ